MYVYIYIYSIFIYLYTKEFTCVPCPHLLVIYLILSYPKTSNFVNIYISFLMSLDHAIGMDVRHKMEAYTYDTFIQKLTKSVRYDSYSYGRSSDPEF
jgi:hypothetical protein